MTTPSTPPSTGSPLDTSIQHQVHPISPHSQSIADTRLHTLRCLLQGYSSLSATTLLQPLSPHFTHEVLPQSLGMPVRGKEDFAHHAAMVFSAFQSFEMKPTELWEDPDRRGVILRCAMEGILKTKEKPQGEKEEEKAEGDVNVEGDVYDPDGDPDSEPVDPSDILGDPAELPDIPKTLLSPITEVTEPGSDIPFLSSFKLSDASSQEEEPTSSPPTSVGDTHPSPPSPAPFLEESLPQQEEEDQSNTDKIHWNNECLLIISFTPCGLQISKIQEFVDSAKAVEMKKKHAPKGFDEASAPPPPTYKPATYLNLDTLKLKDGGCPEPGVHHEHHHLRHSSVTVTELPPSPVESLDSSEEEGGSRGSREGGSSPSKVTAAGCEGLHTHGHQLGSGMDSLDTLDEFITMTEYPSSSQDPPICLVERVVWRSADEAEGSPDTGGADEKGTKGKRLRFAKNLNVDSEDDIVFSSPGSSSYTYSEGAAGVPGSGHAHGSGFWTSRNPIDHEHGIREKERWSGTTIAETIEVIHQFVPPKLLPVEWDDRTGCVSVKKEWVSGAATFVAGVALGKLWFGGGGGGRGGRRSW